MTQTAWAEAIRRHDDNARAAERRKLAADVLADAVSIAIGFLSGEIMTGKAEQRRLAVLKALREAQRSAK